MGSDEKAPSVELLTALIESHYAMHVAELTLLALGDKQVYRVHQTGGPEYVVRLYAAGDHEGPSVSIKDLATILSFLEEQGYPSERIVKTQNGDYTINHTCGQLVMTTYLGKALQSWQPASSSGATSLEHSATFGDKTAILSALGAVLGRLHSLPLPESAPIPPAGMLPKRELSWVAGLLAEVAEDVPQDLQAQYEALLAAVRDMDRLESLPTTLIHNDCNLGNVVITPNGELALIDWEVAGVGPAVLDLGILLRNCFYERESPVNNAGIRALVDGYCQFRRLTHHELQYLLDAVRFMTLVLLASCFSERVYHTLPDDAFIYGAPYPTWQARYDAATEIAAVARARFEEHLDDKIVSLNL